MKNVLSLFVFILLFCRCSLSNNKDHHTAQGDDVITQLSCPMDKEGKRSPIHNGELLIYPTEQDSLSWANNRLLDICLLSNDSLTIYKYGFPVLEGLPSRVYESYDLDTLSAIMGHLGYSAQIENDMLFYQNDSTRFWYGFNNGPASFGEVKTSSRSFAFDSIRVEDSIATTTLFKDLWQSKHLSDFIHSIHINSTYFYNQQEWKKYPWADKIKKSERYYVLEFSVSDGVVTDCFFGVDL